jgi:hypothetical protein
MGPIEAASIFAASVCAPMQGMETRKKCKSTAFALPYYRFPISFEEIFFFQFHLYDKSHSP